MNKVVKVAVASAVAMVLGSTVSGSLLAGLVPAAAADDGKPQNRPRAGGRGG